jgi:hypothetical protein
MSLRSSGTSWRRRGTSDGLSLGRSGQSNFQVLLSICNEPVLKVLIVDHLLHFSALIRPYLPPTSQLAPSSLSSNLLSLLNTQTAFPTTQKALEKQAVLIPSFKTSPFSGTSSKSKSPINAEESADWRDYFESDEEEEADDVGGKNAVGSKKGKKAGGEARRQSSMTVHQGVWALESHRTVFTNAWMGLLSLPLDPAIARHVLVILHHQVLPNMAKARVARTADWLGEWVDRGGPLGLLALNGLFILIRDYNLYVSRGFPLVPSGGWQASRLDMDLTLFPSWTLGTTRTFTTGCTPCSIELSSTSSTERGSSVSPRLSSHLRAFPCLHLHLPVKLAD